MSYVVKPNEVFDVVIVGSGATGGMAAKALTERQLKVLVLEAGKRNTPEELARINAPDCDLPLRGKIPPFLEAQIRPALVKRKKLKEAVYPFYVNEVENPYTHPANQPYLWLRGRQVGGKTLTWGRH